MQMHLQAHMAIKALKIADYVSKLLTSKAKEDDDSPKVIKHKNILFGCTGTIGEKFPFEKYSLSNTKN